MPALFLDRRTSRKGSWLSFSSSLVKRMLSVVVLIVKLNNTLQTSIPANHADEQEHSFDISTRKIKTCTRISRSPAQHPILHNQSAYRHPRNIPPTEAPLPPPMSKTFSHNHYTTGECYYQPTKHQRSNKQRQRINNTPTYQTFTKTAGTNACGQKLPFTSDDGSMNREESSRPKP